MTENINKRQAQIPQADCRPVGENIYDGKILSLDLMINRGGTDYNITVGTLAYFEMLKRYHTPEDPEKTLLERVFQIDRIYDAEQVCEELAGIPMDRLRPFLTEQLPDETSANSN